jgi:hypothetical protein
MTHHTTRESWLLEAVELLRPVIDGGDAFLR